MMADVESRVPEVIGIAVAFIALLILSVGVRLYTRLRLVHSSSIDDALIVIAAAVALAQVLANLIGKSYPRKWLCDIVF
jgi:hypothetical protein